MNILNIDDKITHSFINNIEYLEKSTDYMKEIIITIKEDTTLYINSLVNDAKINIEFNIDENISLNLFELKHGINNKIQYIYNLSNFSKLNLFKFNDVSIIKERNIFNLDMYSNLTCNFKTIATNNQEYDYLIKHVGKNSISNLYLDGVNIMDGKISFNITGEVNKGIIDCTINQNSRIINLNELECVIKPNLLIDEYNVSANHSAKIDKFNKEELFYLQSRGITKDDALKLLIKGFLLNNLGEFNKKEELEEIINKYWR